MLETISVLTLKAAKQQIDDYLAAYAERRANDAKRIGPSYVRLRESINSLIHVGGKRLRPYMVLAAFQAYAPNDSLTDILPAAAAQELIHLSMLIHDDIIDRDYVRYGIPNVAGYYETYYKTFTPRDSERQHFALSAALLAGDALIADAHQIMRDTQRPQQSVRRAEDILSQSIFDVIGGELLDTEVAVLPKGSIAPLTVAEHKTSSYSFVGPLTTGAALAGADEEEIALLARFGKHLGIGFQLKDDLLGIFGDESKTGKSTTSDIREGKRTFMIESFERIADEPQQTEFFAIFHRDDATDAEICRARLLLMESGAAKATEDRIAHHKQECEAIINQLSISPEQRDAFTSLVALCLARES